MYKMSNKQMALVSVLAFVSVFEYQIVNAGSRRSLSDILESGHEYQHAGKFSHPGTSLRIAAWDFAINRSAQNVTNQTEALLGDLEAGFKPYEYPDNEIHYAGPKPLSELGWARYDSSQNIAGMAFKEVEGRTLDIKNRDGVELPANIVIPLNERSILDSVQHLTGKAFQYGLPLLNRGLGPIPEEAEAFQALQKAHVKGRIDDPETPENVLREYAKGKNGSYLPELFRHGPFAGSIKYEGNGKIVYSLLPQAQTKDPNLYHPLDVRVEMHYESTADQLVVDNIQIMKDSLGDEMVTILPGEPLFVLAQRIAGASLSNFATIREHLGICHLKVAQAFTDALKLLPTKHPIRLFLSRFTYRTDMVNSSVGLLVGSDSSQVPAAKSYHSNRLKWILNELHDTFSIRESDPRANAVDQGFMEESIGIDGIKTYTVAKILDPLLGKEIEMPYETLEQSISLFNIFHLAAEDAVVFLSHQEVEEMKPWYNRLCLAIKGIEENYGPFGREAVADLMAIFMHNGTVRHEMKGNLAWNVTSFLPAFPNVINRNNRGGLPNYEDMLNVDYVAVATKGKLPKLKHNLENSEIIFQDLNEIQRNIYGMIYEQMLEGFLEYDRKLYLKRQGKFHPFDLVFKNLEGSVGI